MYIKIVEILLLLMLLLQIGCTGLKANVKIKKLSCEEDAFPKSLQYLEQQYRCTTSNK